MSSCKDCVHYELCFDYTHLKHSKNLPDNREDVCEHFKNKANFVELPCKVGDVVYVITDCSRIMMYHDNDYLTGTGAIECPFENVCKFTECNDENTQVLETYVNYLLCDDDGWSFGCEHINRNYYLDDIGKTVFLTKEEAEQALKEGVDSDNK